MCEKGTERIFNYKFQLFINKNTHLFQWNFKRKNFCTTDHCAIGFIFQPPKIENNNNE